MYIQSMRIQNYRNLTDVTMTFHAEANYLVGENAIGKSSFLRLLQLMSTGRGFQEDDFGTTAEPIRITLCLQLLQHQTEAFVDTPTEHRLAITVQMVQAIQDIYPHLYDATTGEELPLFLIRRIRYIVNSATEHYQPAVTPTLYRELEERLQQWQQNQPGDIGEDGRQPSALSRTAQAFIQREVRLGFMDSGYVKNIFLLAQILSCHDRSRADNMKFISLAALRILTEIFLLTKSKAVPLDHVLVTNEKGQRFLPLLIAIDEPEIHLHPYMQRSILDYFKKLLQNQDPSFQRLLKDLFQIDGLRGQLFIVTHSTDALVDDYRHMIRLYRDGHDQVRAACGATFKVSEEIEKHLIMHFPEVKEAMYSRSVLIVEGETEYGCFQCFGTTLQLPFDYYGICLINARGESSISKIKKLLHYFQIPTVALYDADVKASHRQEQGVYFTDEICFEMDLVKQFIDRGKRRDLDRIIDTACGAHGRATADMIKKACRKLDLNPHDYPPRLLWNVNPRNRIALYVYYFAWLYANKGVILGRLIGKSLGKDDIPPAFVKAIRGASHLAKYCAMTYSRIQ